MKVCNRLFWSREEELEWRTTVLSATRPAIAAATLMTSSSRTREEEMRCIHCLYQESSEPDDECEDLSEAN